MPKVDLLDRGGKKVGDRELPPDLFEANVNVPLMHQVVVAGLASLRAGTHSTKTRAEVRGGGRKPWRQKGTGRARQGSTRAPQWSGGGVAHGPKPRNYDQRTPKKMKAAALRSALTDAHQSDKLAVLDRFEWDEPRTKDAITLITDLELTGKILVVLDQPTETVEKSFNNLPYVKVSYARSLNVYELLAADRILFTSAALDVLEGKDPDSGSTPASASAKAEDEGSDDVHDDASEEGGDDE